MRCRNGSPSGGRYAVKRCNGSTTSWVGVTSIMGNIFIVLLPSTVNRAMAATSIGSLFKDMQSTVGPGTNTGCTGEWNVPDLLAILTKLRIDIKPILKWL